jgi:hypothetical protein
LKAVKMGMVTAIAIFFFKQAQPSHADPRAQAGAMPENISPAFLMPSFRDEPLLSWFLFYMQLPLIALIVKAANEKAKGVPRPWKHLRTGEFMRWLGI